MAVGSFGILSLLIALLSGGANDLLDFAPTEAYWKSKNVTVTVDQLTSDIQTPHAADVSKLITTLGGGSFAEREQATTKLLAQGPAALPGLEKAAKDPDPEIANRARTLIHQIRLNAKGAEVRRLMAIRTLGERKESKALPALRALLASKEMFVADYAARAIALIENKPLPPRATPANDLKADLATLPANCAVVGQLSVHSTKSISLEDLTKNLPLPPGENRDALLTQLNDHVIQIADQIGNVRLEAITFGVADTVGPNDGFFAAVVHGQYDANAVNAYLANLSLPTQNVAGVSVISVPDAPIAFAFPSNNRALFTSSAQPEKLPIKDVVSALANPPASHPLLKQPEFAPFLASLKDDTRFWAVCKVSDSYRAAPVLQPFDTLTLLGQQQKDKLSLRIAGAGKDAAAVKSAVDEVNQGLNEAKTQIPQITRQLPAMKPLADFVQSLDCQASDKNATLTGALQGDALLSLPMMLFPVGVPQAVPVQPPPVQQQVQPNPK